MEHTTGTYCMKCIWEWNETKRRAGIGGEVGFIVEVI